MSNEGDFNPEDPDSSDSELDDEPYNGGQAFAVADDPGEWLSVAVDHMENGKVDRAQKCFANAIKSMPDGISGLARDFDHEFRSYLHDLFMAGATSDQRTRDDLIDSCLHLCINSGRWSFAALCSHILGEDELTVLNYVEYALVEEGGLDIDLYLPFANAFKDEYRNMSNLSLVQRGVSLNGPRISRQE